MTRLRSKNKQAAWMFIAAGVFAIVLFAGPIFSAPDLASVAFESDRHGIAFYGLPAVAIRVALAAGSVLLLNIGWVELHKSSNPTDT